jgi:Spy/CpxP family protein refolding chaperone
MNKRILFLLAAALTATPAAYAQAAAHPHQARSDSAAHAEMMARLDLTDAQKAQIKAIHAKYHAQMKSSHERSDMAGMDSMHEKDDMKDMHGMHGMHGMDSTMKKAMAEVRAVLTPNQQLKFDSMVAEHEHKHHAMSDSTP